MCYTRGHVSACRKSMTTNFKPYTIADTDFLWLEGELAERQYVLRVKDMPDDDKPRERMLRFGPKALSSAELVMIVLGTGSKKEDVATLATRVIKDYGQQALANQNDAKKLSQELEIPLVKSMQLVACAELGRRFFEKNVHGRPVIRTAKDVYQCTREMSLLPKEHLRGLFLDTHYRVIHDETISIGTINSNIIHPREVFKPAIEYGAVAVILVHNHPSGLTKPSRADLAVTEQLVAVGKIVGVHLIDHVIIGRSSYVSVPVEYS